MDLTVSTAGSLLLTTSEASDFLGLDDAVVYGELGTLMQGVQDAAEAYTGRSFTARTIELKLDNAKEVIILPRGPVISITSVETLDTSDSATAVASSDYYLADDERLIFTGSPSLERDYAGLKITYVAGASSKVPQAVKTGLLKALATVFEHREDFVIGHTANNLPDHSKAYFDTWRMHYAPGWAA